MITKTAKLTLTYVLLTLGMYAQSKIKLIVRADDIGFCHAANVAIIKSYKEGIARSAEVIVPSPWFLEAVKMLNDNPGLDVGVHLCLTSEWGAMKWRPMSGRNSLADTNGYFYPFMWPNDLFAKNAGNFLLENSPKISDIETEFRLQISTAKKHIKNLTHLSAHMGCTHIMPEVEELAKKLAAEYALTYQTPEYVKSVKGFGGKDLTPKQKEAQLISILEKLEPGTHLMVTHPCLHTDESAQLGHPTYTNMSKDREAETFALTSPKVMKVIKRRNIELISIKEW